MPLDLHNYINYCNSSITTEINALLFSPTGGLHMLRWASWRINEQSSHSRHSCFPSLNSEVRSESSYPLFIKCDLLTRSNDQ
uniref:Uncharacterized protein n=1 Tax=Picea glauca TaxID=3330 RepID=A0A101LZB8_PICGL|nr:hypothetical protein ABT39_MTgene5056 [Picea glauca]